jgi:uncharacterized protein (DUF58 family)
VLAEPLLSSELLQMLDRMSLVTRRSMAGRLAGNRRSPRRGSSVEFADFRPYSRGDDLRQLDWNLYARLERFFLKLYVAEEELTFHLLLDTSASMAYGEPQKAAYARRLMAAVGYLALQNGDRVRLTLLAGDGHPLPGLRGKAAAAELFAALQQPSPPADGPLSVATRRAVQAMRNGGPLILCSDLLGDDWQETLRAFAARPADLLVLQLLAPQELRPQLSGDLQLQDVETGHQIDVTVDQAVLDAYQHRLDNWLIEVSDFCRPRGIVHQVVDSSLPLEGLLLEHLRRNGVIR